MKMAVDSLFNRLGQRAKYQNKDVLILVFAADDVGEVGFMNTLSPTNNYQSQSGRCSQSGDG